jgi:hypothetical protein
LRFKLQKCFFTALRDTADAVDSHHSSPRAMHHAQRMKKLINELHFSLVKHLMEVSAYDFFFSRQFIGEFLIRSHPIPSRA